MFQIDCLSVFLATCLCVPVCTILKSALDIRGEGKKKKKNLSFADNLKNVKSCCISDNIHMYGQTDNSEQFLFKEIFLNNAKIDCSYSV